MAVPSKRRRSTSYRLGDPSESKTPLDEKLSSLYTSLSDASDLNPLVDLIVLLTQNFGSASTQTETNELQSLHKGVHFLVRSMQTLLKEGRISVANVNEDGLVVGSAEVQTEAEKAVAQWLQARWNDTVQLLCGLLADNSADTRRMALRLLMALQRDASSSLSRVASSSSATDGARVQWSSSPWRLISHALIVGPMQLKTSSCSEVAQDVVDAFTEDYLQEYDDVRYAFCRQVAIFLQETPKSLVMHMHLRPNAVRYLWGLTAIPVQLDDLNTYLVAELEASRRAVQKSEKAKSKAKPNGAVATGEEDDDEEVEDWFSDSDEEGTADKSTTPRTKKGAGLGSAAERAAEAKTSRRRLKRNPPFATAVHSLSAQKAVFSRAWLAVLLPRRTSEGKAIGGILDLGMTHEALVRLHAQILPHLAKPNLLHDFLVDALDAGGATSLLALNGLFTLMTSHNLNYPSFYSRLYALLLADPPFLHVRYRSRFLRLLDVFLSSTHLSAALVASFAKRLSRVALRAPPSAIVVVFPFVWNLCKRHKRCLGLLHREFGGDRFDQGPAGEEDPYNALEPDPLKTGAIDSSLWELASMGATLATLQQQSSSSGGAAGQAHYLASVSSISRILAEPFTKERYDLEDFLDLTYATMFETETNKTLRKREGRKVIEPAVAFDLPRTVDKKRVPAFAASAPVDHSAAAATQAAKKRKMIKGPDGGDQDNQDEDDDHEEEELLAEETGDITSRIFSF